MKIATLFIVVFMTANPFLSLGGAAGTNNVMLGLTPPSLFSTTSTYTAITSANACLAALLASVSVTSTSAVYACVTPAVTAIANTDLANFNTLSASINGYNSLLSTVSNADSNYKKKYAALNVTLTQRIKFPVVPNLYNNIVPSITSVNVLVANMSATNGNISSNLTSLAGMSFNFVAQTNILFANLGATNAQLANSLSTDLSFYANNLTQYLAQQTPLLNAAAAQVAALVANVATLMVNYPASVPIYLNQILAAKVASLNTAAASITTLIASLSTYNAQYPNNFSNNQTDLLASVNTIVSANSAALNTLMSASATSYSTILAAVYALNNQINAVLINLPYLNAELFYSQRLLNWAQTKVEYDITNLLNYQMVWSSSIYNLFTQFDNLIIGENHFYNELQNAPSNSFALVTSTYNLGIWTADQNANFPNGLSADQSARLTTYSLLIAPYNQNFNAQAILRISSQNLDISYGFEAYIGWAITNQGIMGYVAVSDPLAASGLLSINIEYATPITGSFAVSQIATTNYGIATQTGFTPMFVSN